MIILAQLLVFIALNLQVSTCNPPCVMYGLIADCPFRKLRWVPALPPNITALYLGQNHISEINSSSLEAYEQLQDLDLGWQEVILVIKNNAFYNQKKLKRLVLSQHSKELHLEPRAFEGLVNLRQLLLDSSALTDSILSESFLEPLLSLEMLDLSNNKISRLQPGPFFSKLEHFTTLKLKLNSIERLCENDLVGFWGKNFSLMDLHSNFLAKMFENDLDMGCGNPFNGMSFITLDLSSNGFNTKSAEKFFKTIEGTPITYLVFSNIMGKGFSHNNFQDPDEKTFAGLKNSSLETLDLSNNQIFALQSGVFRSMEEARKIDLSKNAINQILQNAFDGLQKKLIWLDLSSNLLGEIRHYMFSNLAVLEELDLSRNHIGMLGHKAFFGLTNLKLLKLSGNSLRSLGSPVTLPNLRFLLLKDNKLETTYGISTLGSGIQHVDIEKNRLTIIIGDVYELATNFRHLKVLLYGGNFIKWCGQSNKPHNSSLKVLDLHDSSLNSLWVQGTCLNLFDPFENLLGLNISFNFLTFLPQGVFKGLRSLTEMDLSFNALTYLQPHIFPSGLRNLYLSHNLLASPDPTSFTSLVFLDLAENHFHCDCNLEGFLNWLIVTNVILLSPIEDLRCEFPANLYKAPLLEFLYTFEPCVDEEKAAEDLMLALFVASALFVIAFILSGVVYARFRGHVFVVYKRIAGRVLEGPRPARPEEEDAQYDAFLCFNNSDYKWVEAALLEKLDKQFSEKNVLRCCFEARDFLPGEDHLSNIRDAIWGSRKTVCIVSKEFLKEGWCLEAFALAQGRMLEELRNILVVMVVGKVTHYQLMKHDVVRAFIQKRQYLVWPEDPQDLEWFYEKLVSQIMEDTDLKKKAKKDRLEVAKPENDDIQLRIEDRVELEPIAAPAM